VIEQAEKWAEFLRSAGGWGVAVVFMGISLKLYMDNRRRDNKMDELLEKRHDQLVGLVEEAATTMRSVMDFLTRHETTFPKIQESLDRVSRDIEWCESVRRPAARQR
jgi:hypothetical protein